MNWQATAEVLERLRIPVIALGVGAQAPAHGRLELSDESLRVWRLIAERCETVGVRGDYTAEVLWDIGVRNLRVVGCPTLFRARNPDLRIDLPPLDSVERVAFTLRREVSATYARDIERYLGLQKQVIADLVGRFAEVTVSAQGEIEEKKIVSRHRRATRAGDRTADGRRLAGRARRPADRPLSDAAVLLRRRRRLRRHGPPPSARAGLPPARQPDRPGERHPVDLLHLRQPDGRVRRDLQDPGFDVFAGEPFELERYWDQALFERFNRAYRHG